MEDYFFSRPLQENYDLSNSHLFKKKAGSAKYYYLLKYDSKIDNDLKELTKFYNKDINFKFFGSHSNLYITDRGFDGLFIDIDPKNAYIKFDKEKEEFIVSANTFTSRLVNYTMEFGYDFASLTGIPGLVGAGIVGNASWARVKEYGQYVKKIMAFDFKEGRFVEIIPDETFFSLRNSYIKQENRYKTRYFIKEVVLKAEYIGKDKVREKYLEQINFRRDSLKIGFIEGCAGSLWANTDLFNKTGRTFRKLIENVPDFNIEFNGARYSEKGMRFFTTKEFTTDHDVAELFKYTVDKLKELYNVEPHKEVIILDYDGEIDLNTFLERYL